MSKRNRVASLFVLPFAVFIWVIGWTMSLAGEEKVTRQNKKALTAHFARHGSCTMPKGAVQV
ncbi:MAG: hypothetical protein ABSB71_13830 [Candidatus Bathyarchaeia archaeon]